MTAAADVRQVAMEIVLIAAEMAVETAVLLIAPMLVTQPVQWVVLLLVLF